MYFTLPAQLPSLGEYWTTVIELRGRLERRSDADFTSAVSDDATSVFTRGRLGLTYRLEPSTLGKIVFQFAQTNIEATTGAGSDVTAQDLVEANIVRRSGASTLTLGRQKVNLGGQRLVGALEWANPSRSWLGARLETGQWGFFWGELESSPVPNSKAQIAFMTYRSGLGETSLIYKHDALPAFRTSIATLDHRLVRSHGNVQLTAEAAFQWGRKAGLDHEAWAATVRGDLGVAERLKLFAEANMATGGGSATSGHAFDNLYPTNHVYYGMMDVQGWTNMSGLAFGATWKASGALDVEVSYHDFSLYDDTDGWYGAGGGINKRGGVPYIDPTGTSGSHVGSEVDFFARYRLNRATTLEGGFGIFTPGEFVKSFVGSTADSTFGYVQVSLKF